MNAAHPPSTWNRFTDEARRAYREYLTLPSVVIVILLALALGLSWLETSDVAWMGRVQESLRARLLGDSNATRSALGALAGGLITITALTFTVLLIAVQQAANSMSTMILDQFLRRRINGFTFGYFVGASVFVLVVLATAGEGRDPVLSALVAFVLTGLALYFLAVLVYLTLTQMRPAVVLDAIHRGTLGARERQLRLIRRMRSRASAEGEVRATARARGEGYLIDLDLSEFERALRGSDIEVVLRVRFGDYVARGDAVADLRSARPLPGGAAPETVSAILRSLRLGYARDLHVDPLNGIEQITTIGWTTISTARQSPAAGREAINSLRGLLARWLEEEESDAHGELPVVYEDRLMLELITAFESLAAVTVRPLQHQNLAHILRAFASMLERVPDEMRRVIEEVVLRALSRLEEQVWTTELEEGVAEIAAALDAAGMEGGAAAVRRVAERAADEVPERGAQEA